MRNLWIAAIALASASASNAAPSSRGGSSSPKPSSELDGQKVCLVKCEGKGQDASKNILEAVHECNNGGRVVFEKNNEYTIGTALDLTFLNNIEIG
jgi:galacturan 1,4-alpha-galacturonidase